MLTIGVTSAAFQDESRAVLTGADGSIDSGIGYPEQPAIWLSDAGNSGYVTPPPAGRDHWMHSNDLPISTQADNTLQLIVLVIPKYGAPYAIDVTPTLHTGIEPDSGEIDPFPWLRFMVTLPDGTTFENLSAVEFNALPERLFTVCGTGGSGECPYGFTISVTLDPLAPYMVHDAKADVRVTFDGMTTPWRVSGNE